MFVVCQEFCNSLIVWILTKFFFNLEWSIILLEILDIVLIILKIFEEAYSDVDRPIQESFFFKVERILHKLNES